MVAELVALAPDPSPLIPRDENIGTLRIFGQNDPSEWTFKQDSREKSVWGGFAAVGGFWTIMNGVFGIMFGSSLLLIVFGEDTFLSKVATISAPNPRPVTLLGVKPLSLFGILDGLQSERVRDAWHDDYPLLMREAKIPPEERGHLALMRDHLLELGPMEYRSTDIEGGPPHMGYV